MLKQRNRHAPKLILITVNTYLSGLMSQVYSLVS